jgi:hypothetical protein
MRSSHPRSPIDHPSNGSKSQFFGQLWSLFLYFFCVTVHLSKERFPKQRKSKLQPCADDILDNLPNHGPAEPSQTPNTPIQEPITRSRTNKLQQEVNSFLTKIDYNTNENLILPKLYIYIYVLLKFTHMGATAGPKKMSYTKDEMSYEEAKPSQ